MHEVGVLRDVRTKIKQTNLDFPLKNKNVATRNKLAIQYLVTCTITTNTIVRAMYMYIVALKANLQSQSSHTWNTINSCSVGKQCDLSDQFGVQTYCPIG